MWTRRWQWALVTVVVVLAFPFHAAADWNSAGRDAAMNRAVPAALGTALYRWWTFDAGSRPAPPVVANGMVYFGTEAGTFYALDATSGEVQWTFDVPNGRIRYPAAVNLGSVYFGAGDLTSGTLYALNAWDGRLRWTHKYAGHMSLAPVIDHPRIYFGHNGQTGRVVALSVFDGVREWDFAADHYLSGQLAVGGGYVLAGTTLADGNRSYLYALNATTGLRSWRVVLTGYSSGISVVDKSRAVVTTGGASTGGIHALDLSTGGLLWKYVARVYNFWSPPAVMDGVVYGLNKGTVHAVYLDEGGLAWSTDLPVRGTDGPLPVSLAPVAGLDVVYITYAHVDPSTTSNMYILGRLNGELLWQGDPGTRLMAGLAVSGGVAYWAGENGRLEAWKQLDVLVESSGGVGGALSGFVEDDGGWRTWVPVRPLLEAAGYTVEWDQENRRVLAFKQGVPGIVLTLGQARVELGGTAKTLDRAPRLVGGRTVVPLRALVEAMQGVVTWDGGSLTVTCRLP
ncbi:MAG: PQQ-binding-like beta-propeller repeat protein [Bacillota bacterium]